MKKTIKIILIPVVLLGSLCGCIYAAFMHGFNSAVNEMEN